MEQVNNSLQERFIVYALVLTFILLLFLGIKKVVIGIKQNKRWAKNVAVLITILLVILLIGGFIFYLYAKALGEAFSTGL